MALRVLERLIKHRNVLEGFMECQYGLLDHLCGVLTREQEESVNEHHENMFTQNRALLKLFCEEEFAAETHQTFLDALRMTFQMHLAAYVELDGGTKYRPNGLILDS